MGLWARVGEGVDEVEVLVLDVEDEDLVLDEDVEVRVELAEELVETLVEVVEVLVLEVGLLVVLVVDDTAREETAATLYNSSLFPLPQYSNGLPLQVMLQSDRGALALDLETELSQ